MAEARHHHRQRHRQAQAATTPLTATAALSRMRRARSTASIGSRRLRHQRREPVVQQRAHRGRQHADAADQQQAHRQIRRQRHARDGGSIGQHRRHREQPASQPVAAPAWQRRAQALERLRQRQRARPARAGSQPPAIAATTPRPPYSSAAGVLHCSCGRTPEVAAAQVAAQQRSAEGPRRRPARCPSALPITPSSATRPAPAADAGAR
jgi:hypothetical protein